MNILGIGGVLGDAAAVLIRDGQIAAAVEENKLVRRSHSARLPEEAIASCLRIAGLSPEDVNYVALARPFPPGAALPLALQAFTNGRIVSIDHHAAHAASAYLASPFSEATVITLDRQGDLRCGAKWRGEGNHLTLEDEILYPDSIGQLYGRVTELLGFTSRADEHRLQWLSTAGEPRWLDVFEEMTGGTMTAGPSFDRSYFDFGRQGKGGFSAKFFERTGLDSNAEWSPQVRADLAASVQRALENYVMRLAAGAKNVCLAGGVAWNALMVSALENSGRYEGVFAQPAAGNAGTALGAALQVYHDVGGPPAPRIDGGGYCLGPSFTAHGV